MVRFSTLEVVLGRKLDLVDTLKWSNEKSPSTISSTDKNKNII